MVLPQRTRSSFHHILRLALQLLQVIEQHLSHTHPHTHVKTYNKVNFTCERYQIWFDSVHIHVVVPPSMPCPKPDVYRLDQ